MIYSLKQFSSQFFVDISSSVYSYLLFQKFCKQDKVLISRGVGRGKETYSNINSSLHNDTVYIASTAQQGCDFGTSDREDLNHPPAWVWMLKYEIVYLKGVSSELFSAIRVKSQS